MRCCKSITYILNSVKTRRKKLFYLFLKDSDIKKRKNTQSSIIIRSQSIKKCWSKKINLFLLFIYYYLFILKKISQLKPFKNAKISVKETHLIFLG